MLNYFNLVGEVVVQETNKINGLCKGEGIFGTLKPNSYFHPYPHRGRNRRPASLCGAAREPDPALYSYDAGNRRWVLKEGVE